MASASTNQDVAPKRDDSVGFGQAAADEIAKYVPQSVGVYVKKAGPYVDKVGQLLNVWFPVVAAFWNKSVVLYRSIEKYHPEEYFPMAFGLVLAFFGGNFIALIAAIEAFKLCGWETTKRCLLALYGDYLVVKEASDKDDLVDDNHDGIADVLQINKRELATRKIKLAVKSCNPDVIGEALFGLNTVGEELFSGTPGDVLRKVPWYIIAMLAVIATLRAEFAYTVTLGSAIGTITAKVVYTISFPFLRQIVPVDYQKWISPLIKYTCRGFGVSIAWWLQTLSSAMHSALRGGEQFTKGLIKFLARNGYSATITEGSVIFAALMYAVALAGFYWQIINGFSLIFPLNFLLLPFTIAEWTVRYVISY